MEEVLQKAGDILVEDVSIITSDGTSHNIIPQVLTIQVFEDMLSPFMSGSIILNDGVALPSNLKLVGQEILRLKLKTPTIDKKNYIQGDFYIYKLDNYALASDTVSVYTLHFISIEAIVDINATISKAYRGKCSEIIQNIFSEFKSKKKLNIEQTPNATSYISNFWSPTENIRYVARRALNQKNNPNMIFFENRNGFNFVSFDTLATQEVSQYFVKDNFVREILPNGIARRNIDDEYKRINALKIDNVFDYIDMTNKGAFTSKIISNDIVTKKYSVENYDIKTEWGSREHSNKFPLFSNALLSSTSKIYTANKQYGTYNGFPDATDSKYKQKRSASLAQLSSNRITIEVFGRTDYTVGQLVDVTIYKTAPARVDDSAKDLIDGMLSGKYIISAIHHSITRNNHQSTLELIKDSTMVDITK